MNNAPLFKIEYKAREHANTKLMTPSETVTHLKYVLQEAKAENGLL